MSDAEQQRTFHSVNIEEYREQLRNLSAAREQAASNSSIGRFILWWNHFGASLLFMTYFHILPLIQTGFERETRIQVRTLKYVLA